MLIVAGFVRASVSLMDLHQKELVPRPCSEYSLESSHVIDHAHVLPRTALSSARLLVSRHLLNLGKMRPL